VRTSQDEIDEHPRDEDVEALGDETTACPSCGAEVYDDADVCPRCGDALTAAPRVSRLAWVAAGLAALLVVAMVIRLVL
jgi:uncharacterized paraquat-inducible protein A